MTPPSAFGEDRATFLFHPLRFQTTPLLIHYSRYVIALFMEFEGCFDGYAVPISRRPLERLELSLPAPEADALSTELQGRMKNFTTLNF